MKTAAIKLENMPITVLKGVGAKFAETLAKIGLNTVQDLLFHLPYRYIDKTQVRSIYSLRINDVSLVQGQVLESQIVMGRRRSLAVKIDDGSGTLSLRFFHFNAAQKNSFAKGATVRAFGELRPGGSGAEMYHPEYEIIAADTPAPTQQTLTPLYHLTEGLSQPRLRSLTEQAAELLSTHGPDELLPLEANRQFGVDSLSDALRYIHFPPQDADLATLIAGSHPCQQRLAFEELLAHFLVKQEIRLEAQSLEAPEIEPKADYLQPFLDLLPFSPTQAQQRVQKEIAHDMQTPKPMLRMVQGDVGSGKTLVAAMAALAAIRAGYQVALVAPTEILAEQHYQGFSKWFDALGIRTEWLVGALSPKQKQACYQRMQDHQCDLVVGTHALFQDPVMFAKLGLSIIDEQHRFGVHQRLSLREKSLIGLVPHQLVMTATPIPRTLAMTSYAELDFSIIDELPPGRTPIKTAAVSQKRKADVVTRIREVCKEQRQVYWVCPLIEESETLSAANAEQTFIDLERELAEFKVGLIHGRLKPAEKEARMAEFKSGNTQILVATTVIEVGVDVPNATVMIIENPERLGLAQLHQLRGRVGRGSAESHCILLYGDKLSKAGTQRLQILRESSDGFVIAEKDLEMRGPGEFLGTRQAGDMLYRIADHERDAHMFDFVHHCGRSLLSNEPQRARQLIERWFAQRKDYAHA